MDVSWKVNIDNALKQLKNTNEKIRIQLNKTEISRERNNDIKCKILHLLKLHKQIIDINKNDLNLNVTFNRTELSRMLNQININNFNIKIDHNIIYKIYADINKLTSYIKEQRNRKIKQKNTSFEYQKQYLQELEMIRLRKNDKIRKNKLLIEIDPIKAFNRNVSVKASIPTNDTKYYENLYQDKMHMLDDVIIKYRFHYENISNDEWITVSNKDDIYIDDNIIPKHENRYLITLDYRKPNALNQYCSFSGFDLVVLNKSETHPYALYTFVKSTGEISNPFLRNRPYEERKGRGVEFYIGYDERDNYDTFIDGGRTQYTFDKINDIYKLNCEDQNVIQSRRMTSVEPSRSDSSNFMRNKPLRDMAIYNEKLYLAYHECNGDLIESEEAEIKSRITELLSKSRPVISIVWLDEMHWLKLNGGVNPLFTGSSLQNPLDMLNLQPIMNRVSNHIIFPRSHFKIVQQVRNNDYIKFINNKSISTNDIYYNYPNDSHSIINIVMNQIEEAFNLLRAEDRCLSTSGRIEAPLTYEKIGINQINQDPLGILIQYPGDTLQIDKLDIINPIFYKYIYDKMLYNKDNHPYKYIYNIPSPPADIVVLSIRRYKQLVSVIQACVYFNYEENDGEEIKNNQISWGAINKNENEIILIMNSAGYITIYCPILLPYDRYCIQSDCTVWDMMNPAFTELFS